MTHGPVNRGVGAEYCIGNVLGSGTQTNTLREEVTDLPDDSFFAQLRTTDNDVQGLSADRQDLT